MVINNKFEEPFNKFANPYTPIMSLNRTDVKAKLSNKFYEEISLTDYNDKVIEFVQMPTKEYNTKIINEHSDTLLSRLKLNKTLLKVKGSNIFLMTGANYKSTTSRNSSPRTHQTNSHRSYSERPVSFYSTALSMNDNLINNYLYIKDIDKLKKLINALNQQITVI